MEHTILVYGWKRHTISVLSISWFCKLVQHNSNVVNIICVHNRLFSFYHYCRLLLLCIVEWSGDIIVEAGNGVYLHCCKSIRLKNISYDVKHRNCFYLLILFLIMCYVHYPRQHIVPSAQMICNQQKPCGIIYGREHKVCQSPYSDLTIAWCFHHCFTSLHHFPQSHSTWKRQRYGMMTRLQYISLRSRYRSL